MYKIFKKMTLSMLLLAFMTILGSFVSAGYYDFYFESCCTRSYAYPAYTGVYNAQGDPSYLRYDPYSYSVEYPTRSIPSYPYNYYTTEYYNTYSYYPTYYYGSNRVFRGQTYVYPSYAVRIS